MNSRRFRLAALLAFAAPVMAHADDLTGTDRFLCAPAQVTYCYARGECESGPPWKWDMPSFINVDLKKKTMSTPPSSAEQRRSPLTHLERADGQILLQGTENGRAFSMVVVEQTGLASMSVTLDGIAISAFGTCTPAP